MSCINSGCSNCTLSARVERVRDRESVRMCVSGEIPIPGIGKPRVKYMYFCNSYNTVHVRDDH